MYDVFISKDAQYYDRSLCIHFFFVRVSVFELLLILYFSVVNSDLGLIRSVVGKQRSVALRNMPLTLTYFN